MTRKEIQNQNRKFREEIEGLRAIAAMLVAIYHIWFGNVSGGVDVFFVVSGFLITTSLLSRYERTGEIDFLDFILRLAKRLFPLAFLVLFTVSIAAIFLLPEIQWAQTVKELIASALYYQNWQLAFNSVDYLAQNNEASPFQHFWAMSIQGQFYLIWPTLLFLAISLAKYLFNKSVRTTFLVTLITVFIISFSYSIYKTSVNQPWAYFDTFTRVWEFSLGGIVALLISKIVLRKSVSFIIGWIGLFSIIILGQIIQVSTVFPGYAALWPTLSAIIIIIAGNQGGKWGVHRLLSSKPLMKMGSISYAFYLWHWPILIFYFILTNNEKVSILDGLLIIIFSIVLSYLSTMFIEKPIRNQNPKTFINKILIPVSLMIPVLIFASIWSSYIEKNQVTLAFSSQEDDYYGALALINGKDEITINSDVPIIPSAMQARNDLPLNYLEGCHQKAGKSDVIKCEFGELTEYEFSIAIVGGSHSAHWLPAFIEFSEEEKIKVINYTKSGCRFTSEDDIVDDCIDWNNNLIEVLSSDKPDFVFTLADRSDKSNVPIGFVEQWEKLNNIDIPVIAIRDTPRFDFDMAVCVEENGPISDECIVNREDVLPYHSPWDKLINKPKNVHYIDLTDYFCETSECKPVVGNILIYRDKSHITSTYAKSLGPILKQEIMSIIK